MPQFQSGEKPIGIDAVEPGGAGPFAAIVLLHGSGGNIGFWAERFAAPLRQFGIALYAPHYFGRTGTKRADAATILDGYHFPLWTETVGDAISWVAARPGVDVGRIALLGISLGAFLAVARAHFDPRIGAVLEISGGLPRPSAAVTVPRFPPTLVVHGEADTVVPVSEARELVRWLKSRDVPHQTELLPGEGHWFSAAAQGRILLAMAGFLGRHFVPARSVSDGQDSTLAETRRGGGR